MNYLTQRHQRMIMYLIKHKSLTRKDQHFWLSPFFYAQMGKLEGIGIIKKAWNEGRLEYSLTKKGRDFADELKSVIGEWKIEEDEI